MNLPKSTYYYELSKVDQVDLRNKEIKEKIQEIFTSNKGRYGVRRVHQALLSKGYIVNHKRVQRLMHKMQLLGKRPKEKYHSYMGNVGKVATETLQQLSHVLSGLQMYPNLTLHGANATYRQY